MKFSRINASVALCLGLAAASFAAITIPKGMDVDLAFDQALSSKTAKAGDRVMLHVMKDVTVHGKTVIKRGTRVSATISDVDKKGRFGKNARLKFTINPLKVMGSTVTLQPRQKGAIVGGTRGNQAAAVAGGGALVLGPLGLAAGYFVVGKTVNVKVGDKLQTEVARDVRIG
jgi:hypothetical protein